MEVLQVGEGHPDSLSSMSYLELTYRKEGRGGQEAVCAGNGWRRREQTRTTSWTKPFALWATTDRDSSKPWTGKTFLALAE
jgi:hypothetical protein